jgi:hypothetical protein
MQSENGASTPAALDVLKSNAIAAGYAADDINVRFATSAEYAALIAASTPPSPNVEAFVEELKSAIGGIVASNALAKSYPLFYPALQVRNFADVQALIIDAHATRVLSDPQYAVFQQLAVKHRIPVTLP